MAKALHVPPFSAPVVRQGTRVLARDRAFRRRLRAAYPGRPFAQALRDLFDRPMPQKYLGRELGTTQRPRFTYAETARLRLQPRSMDHRTDGLRRSTHARAMARDFPGPWDRLGALRMDPRDPVPYERQARVVLRPVAQRTGVPVSTMVQVLRKGAFAYGRSHRPGMTRSGWARARLSSFLYKGCTHFNPDHGLVETARNPQSRRWWDGRPCLCRKRQQCGQYGVSTAADAVRRRTRGPSRRKFSPGSPRVQKRRWS